MPSLNAPPVGGGRFVPGAGPGQRVELIVDRDGDGRAEVAMVTTPHLGGILRVFRRDGRQPVELARPAGFSNHVIARRNLRIITLEGGRLVDLGRCALPAKLIGAIRVVSPAEISVGLSNGRHNIHLDDCRAI